MSRRSQLLFIPPGGGAPEPMFESEDGIPLLWFAVFGTRNNWTPGDTVEERGGTSASRSRFDTSVEDAEYRLGEAETALSEQERVWPFYAPLAILKRRVGARSKSGVLRLSAPWADADAETHEQLKAAIAFMENAVNYLGQDRYDDARRTLTNLMPFSPAAYDCIHEKPMGKHPGFEHVAEPSLRIAHQLLGTPSRDADAFAKAARESGTGNLDAWRALPPPPEPKPLAAPPVPKAEPKNASRAKPAAFPVVARNSRHSRDAVKKQTVAAEPAPKAKEPEKKQGIAAKIGAFFKRGK